MFTAGSNKRSSDSSAFIFYEDQDTTSRPFIVEHSWPSGLSEYSCFIDRRSGTDSVDSKGNAGIRLKDGGRILANGKRVLSLKDGSAILKEDPLSFMDENTITLGKRTTTPYFDLNKFIYSQRNRKIKESIYDLELDTVTSDSSSEFSEIQQILEESEDISRPEIYYLKCVRDLPCVEAVFYQTMPELKCISTVLTTRDLDVTERIYDIEIRVSEKYTGEQFYFRVDWLHDNVDLNSIIKDKRVLFHKRSIDA
ncbi:hypothetical protein MTBBW1_1610028 [Desulfamplus magnetovallimortis]|uniref:Uncharacterized protein n=1 Tax=Desulfamplus magnetovallimortis TaxID=1246637 RepID=A0A1W1H8V1_9BACT|nr:hypothetical protein [Desulfamplus magnetovallimortis]SLM28866.1 hypothetical protein MTBBW1_1610028 [Desulfamplus magnetovallimortis]